MKKPITLVAVAMSLLMAGTAAFGQDTPPPVDTDKKQKRGRLKVRKMKPLNGPPGAAVTIRGRGFRAGDVVRFGPNKVTPTKVAGKRITFAVPDLAPGSHDVVVVRGDQNLAAGKFEVTAKSAGTAAGKTQDPDRHRAPPATSADPDKPATSADPDTPATAATGATMVDPDAPATAAPTAPPPVDDDAAKKRRLKRWKRARGGPTVFKFKQRKGKPGQFVIRGRNFTPKMTVAVNKQVIEGAKVTAKRIIFQMPEVQGKAVIMLRAPTLRRPIFVGVYEASQPDPDGAAAEAAEKQREETIRKDAREQWMIRRAKLAKTRAARLAHYKKRWEDLRAKRATRRAQRLEKLQKQWDPDLLNNDQTRAELAVHAERSARLNQMLQLAEVESQSDMVVRIRLAISREAARHGQRMETLKKALAASAGDADK